MIFLDSLSTRLMRPDDGGDMGSTASGTVDTSTSVASPSPTTAPAADAAPAVSSPAPAPKTMLEAVSQQLDASAAAGQPRDPQGRFAAKPGETAPAAPAAPAVPGAPSTAAPAAAAPKPAADPVDDLLAMPEGLQPKAQERFQRLVATNKEQAAQLEERTQQLTYVRDSFQRNGIQQAQFEQAANIMGLMNRGDWRGALAALDQQRKHIAMQLGEPLPGVDALSDYPDLRGAVDNLQITEQHAMEIARGRAARFQAEQQQEQSQRTQQAEQQQHAAFQAGQSAVDRLCKQLAATDLDWPVIEAQLLPEIGNLLRGVPPNQWENAVRTQYSLMKRMGAAGRVNASPAAPALRPTGQASPGNAPKTMHEAMWGTPPSL